jgi:hypothetical protein
MSTSRPYLRHRSRVLGALLACTPAAMGCSSADGSGFAAPGASAQGHQGADGGGPAPLASSGDAGSVISGPPAADGSTFAPTPSGSQADQILQGSCATYTVKSSLRPANLLFVLDRTGTMACNPPPTTSSEVCEQVPQRANPALPSKWEITRDALRSAIESLPTNASIGVSYFSNNGECGVSSEPSVAIAPASSGQLATVGASLGSVTPGGGTPLVGAVVLAYRHLHELALAGTITGNKFVVLLSDGEQSEECANPPICTDVASCYSLLLQRELPKAAGPGVGIRTFVIGAPGSEPSRSVLSQIAQLGGTAAAGCDVAAGNCHFDMTKSTNFGEALSMAFRSILGEAVSCELDLPKPAEGGEPDRSAINVVYTPSAGAAVVVPQDASKACDTGAEGWQFTDGPTPRIRLCGRACESVRGDTGGRVDVVLGCPVVVL